MSGYLICEDEWATVKSIRRHEEFPFPNGKHRIYQRRKEHDKRERKQRPPPRIIWKQLDPITLVESQQTHNVYDVRALQSTTAPSFLTRADPSSLSWKCRIDASPWIRREHRDTHLNSTPDSWISELFVITFKRHRVEREP